jgi:cysteine-rich repeat protein
MLIVSEFVEMELKVEKIVWILLKFEASGEQCDDGNLNNGDCCSKTCTFEGAGTVCRAAGGACDIAETCTGSSYPCPADVKQPNTTICRSADVADPCDPVEVCLTLYHFAN